MKNLLPWYLISTLCICHATYLTDQRKFCIHYKHSNHCYLICFLEKVLCDLQSAFSLVSTLPSLMTCNANTPTMNSLLCCVASPSAAPTVVITTIDLLSDDKNKGTQYALKGTIPTTIGLLTALRTINIPYQSISLTIPNEIGLISSLNILQLQGNFFSGTIPSSIGQLSALRVLHLDNNVNAYTASTIPGTGPGLRGTIPSSFSKLSSLTMLNLGNNLLSGTIPSSLGGLSLLSELDLDVNFFTGMVPSSLCNSKLNIFRFSVNKLCCYATCFASAPGSNVFGSSDNLVTGAQQRCNPYSPTMCPIRNCTSAVSNGQCSPTSSPTYSKFINYFFHFSFKFSAMV